ARDLAAQEPAAGLYPRALPDLLRAALLSGPHALVARARPSGDAALLPDRLPGSARPRPPRQGALAGGDLPAGHPALLVERAGAHLLLDDGAARRRPHRRPGTS